MVDPEDAAEAMKLLTQAAQTLNREAAAFRIATGLSVSLYVNGYEFGDRVGVRIEGELIDPHVKPGDEG